MKQAATRTRTSKRGVIADLAAGRGRVFASHTRIEKPVGNNNAHATKNLSEMGQYPPDVDEMGGRRNGKTCPVVPIMVPRLEEAK
jgi:hypothetical protein